MVTAALRFTFALPDPRPAEQAEVFRAALDMARYGDGRGLTAVTVDEHHATDYGWSPNPLLEAALFLGATSRLVVSVAAALAPLHDPVRLAEDIAVLDQASGGRIVVALGLGYRPVEYAVLGKDFSRRGSLMDEALTILLQAWSGEPVERGGVSVRVTPLPLTQPHPRILVGGTSPATARRAVRFRLPLQIADHLPELRDYYVELCRAEGIEPDVSMTPADAGMTFLAEDPDEAWATLGPHFLWEAVHYGRWATDDMRSVMHTQATTLDELQATGRYRILSPEQLIAELRAKGPAAGVSLYPLCGGMPIDAGWRSVQLLLDDVLPALADAPAEAAAGE